MKTILMILFFAGGAHAGVPYWHPPMASTSTAYGTGYLSGLFKVYPATTTAAASPSIMLDGVNRQVTARNGAAVSTMSSTGFYGNGSGLTNATNAAYAAALSTAVFTTNSYADPAWLTSIGISKINLSTVTANHVLKAGDTMTGMLSGTKIQLTGQLISSGTGNNYFGGTIGIGGAAKSYLSGAYNALDINAGRTSLMSSSATPQTNLLTNGYYDNTDSRWEYAQSGYAASNLMQQSGDFIFYSTGTGNGDTALTFNELLRVKASGYIGIGGPAPAAPLGIAHATCDSNNDCIRFGLNDTSYYNSFSSLLSATAGGNILGINVNASSAANSRVRVMSLLGNGKVGIGTISPPALLSLVTIESDTPGLIQANNWNGAYAVRLDSGTTTGTYSNLIFEGQKASVWTPILTLNRNSNFVGIGREPSEKLDVNGGIRIIGSNALSFGNVLAEESINTVADSGNMFHYARGAYTFYGDTNANDAANGIVFNFLTKSVSKAVILNNGNFGIGDSAPQAKLVVNGPIFSSSTIFGANFVGSGVGLTGLPGGGDAVLAATQTFTGVNTITPNYAVWVDSKAAGVAGGSSQSDDWHARDLTVEIADTGNIGTLTASSVTLAAGTYFCEWSSPFYGGLVYQTRLRNVTAGSTIQAGSNGYCDNTSLPHCVSNGMARFVLTGSTNVSLQYIVSGAKATNGLGYASAWGEASIFSILKCTKER